MSAMWRLVFRAVLAGVTTFCVQLQGSTSWDAAVLKAAIVAAILATAEALTPLNAVVGVGKEKKP